jgi:hypothetical protein
LIVCAVAILGYILWKVDLHREQKLKQGLQSILKITTKLYGLVGGADER